MKDTILINAKVKREYRQWLLEAKGLSIASVDQMLRAISFYEKIFPNEDYGLFNSERALKLKERLRNKVHNQKCISSNSVRTYLMHLRSFFEWLCAQPGYKSRISITSMEYLSVTKKEVRLAAQFHTRDFPSIDHIQKLISSIETNTIIDRRDRALIAFTFLTGMRDAAIISLPVACINIQKLYVTQDPRMGVKTKFNKSILSKIFRFDDEMIDIVLDWVDCLKQMKFAPNDPVFPRAKMEMIEDGFSYKEAENVEPCYWSTVNSLRKIFKERSAKANLPYYPPHTFRHSTIHYAMEIARKGGEIKAISQNFGHESINTTMSVYANYQSDKLLEVLENMEMDKVKRQPTDEFKKDLEEVFKKHLKNA